MPQKRLPGPASRWVSLATAGTLALDFSNIISDNDDSEKP